MRPGFARRWNLCRWPQNRPSSKPLSGLVVSVMRADFRDAQAHAEGSALQIRVVLENKSRESWKPESFFMGWQFFDPATNFFIQEGEWTPLPKEVGPGETVAL